jgi:thioredoxin-related protein
MLLPLRPALPALALLAFACAAPVSADGQAKKASPPAATAAPASDAPIYDPDLNGEKAIAAAQKVAADSGRRLLVNLGTNDCPPCAVVNRALYKDKFFEVFSHQFVAEYVDVSNMPNAALIDKYFINPKAALPAIIIFMPDGRLIEALAHGEMAAIAKKGEPAVQEWILKRFAKSDL